MNRILILITADDWRQLSGALRSARTQAKKPNRLTFGLVLGKEPEMEEQQEMLALGTVQYLTGLCSFRERFLSMWQGETAVLCAHPVMRFEANWDEKLMLQLAMANRADFGKVLLTGYLPTPRDAVDVVRPVAIDCFDAEGTLHFRPGLPMRYARRSERALFIHQDFVFAPPAFFNDLPDDDTPLFLAAYRAGWHVATPNGVAIRLKQMMPVNAAVLYAKDHEERLDEEFGVNILEHTFTHMAACGIFQPALKYEMHVPIGVRLQELWREYPAEVWRQYAEKWIKSIKGVLKRTDGEAMTEPQPLVVTLRLKGMTQTGLPQEQKRRFLNLCEIESMPLLAFADAESMKETQLQLPNALQYKRRYALPISGTVTTTMADDYIRLSKPFLMNRARERLLGYTHYGWIDPDYLSYRVYQGVHLDWYTICTDKIVLALVNSEPDASLLMIPEPMLTEYKEAVAEKVVYYLKAYNHLPTEKTLLKMLIEEHEEWFSLIPLPQTRSLLRVTMPVRGEEIGTRLKVKKKRTLKQMKRVEFPVVKPVITGLVKKRPPLLERRLHVIRNGSELQ